MSEHGFFGLHSAIAARIAVWVGLCVSLATLSAAEPKDRPDHAPAVAFVGLHGGVFGILKGMAGETGLRLEYVTDEQIAKEEVDLSRYQIVFLQHVRGEDADHYQRLVLAAKARTACRDL